MEKFEYRTLMIESEGIMGGKLDLHLWEWQLNEMGAQGWELVSTLPTTQGHGSTRWVVSVFKRRVE